MLKTLGKYEIISEVGRGAMGEVYKARDPLIGRLVALKTITSGLLGRPDLLERFYQEARSAGSLQHPNIVTIYELGKESNVPFIAMQFIDGETLEKLIERRAVLPLSQKIGFMVAVCRALDHAHKHGVVHRDIKPGNIMVTKEGTVQVVDFGIARVMDSSNTQTNMLIGTLGYMSPQQIHGERADERADIWASGVTFYELLCYQRPFNGENQPALMMNIINNQTPHIRENVPECPLELEAVIEKMLQKDSEQRFQTMEDILLELEPIWRRSQEETVADLIASSEDLLNARDLSAAQKEARKAVEINPSNVRAKSLLEKINQQMKQSQVLEQIQNQVARAKGLFEEGRFQEASVEAEAAQKMGSVLAATHEVFAVARRIVEDARTVQQGVQASRQRLAAGALTEAGEELQSALQLQPNNTHIKSLQKQIQDQIARREERKRLASTLQQGRLLWAERRYDECIELLTKTQREFPDEQEVSKLLETARNDQAEQQRQERLAEAKGSLAAQRFEDALAIVGALQKEHPEDEEVLSLKQLIAQSYDKFRRQQAFQHEMEALRSFVHSGKFAEVLARGGKLSKDFPDELELNELLGFARDEEEKRQLDLLLSDIRDQVSAEDFSGAAAAAEKGLKRFPNNSQLTKLLAEARQSLERIRLSEQYVRNGKQFLRDGSLVQATQEIEKGLRLDPKNSQLLGLQKQILDQVARRRERDRLSAVLQQARICWAEQRYDECISLLTAIQKEFPGEQEITDLLDRARHDQSEQFKKQRLSEIHKLIADRRFGDATAAVSALEKRYVGDREVQKARSLILREQEAHERQQRLHEEMENLGNLIKAANFSEAISQGEKLLREYPQEAELAELLKFARDEQGRIEKRRRLEQLLKKVSEQIKEERFSDATKSVNQGLTEFPKNTELLILQDRALKEKLAKEKQELLANRVKEIEQRIHREELSDAIDLARQTQVTIGPDPVVADLLHKAEWESKQRKDRQDQTLVEARTAIAAGSFSDATVMLQGALDKKLFSNSDSRVSELLTEIQKKQAEATQIVPPDALIGPSDPSGPPSWPRSSPEAAKDYVYQPRGEGIVSDSPQQTDSPTALLSATRLGNLKETPSTTWATSSVAEETADRDLSADLIGQVVPGSSDTIRKKSKNKLLLLVGAAGLALLIVAGHFLLPHPSSHELALQKEAKDLRTAGKLRSAIDTYRQLVKEHGALDKEAEAEAESLEKTSEQETELYSQAQTAQQTAKNKTDYSKARDLYDKVVSINGDRKADALKSISGIDLVLKTDPGKIEEQASNALNAGATYFQNKDWPKARGKFDFVKALNTPASAKADDYLSQMSRAEEALYQKAQSDSQAAKATGNASQLPQIENELQQVLAYHGRYYDEANNLLAGMKTYGGEEASFDAGVTYFQKKDWPQARDKFNYVRNLNIPNSPLLPQANNYLNQMKRAEEDLFRAAENLAQTARTTNNATQLADAKNELQQVVSYQGMYRDQASKFLEELNAYRAVDPKPIAGQIEALINQQNFYEARMELSQLSKFPDYYGPESGKLDNAESQFVGGAPGLLSAVARSQNPDRQKLDDLRTKLSGIVNGKGASADAAQTFLSKSIPDVDTTFRAIVDEHKSLAKAISDYNMADQNKDKRTMEGTVQPEFQKLAAGGGFLVPEAQDYLKRISEIRWPPGTGDENEIRAAIQQLSAAFSSRSMSALEAIWPKMGSDKNKLKAVFDAAQSVSRQFNIDSITIRPDGNSATAVGKYEGSIREGGKDFPSSGDFYVRLSKKNGKWSIDEANF